MAASSRRYQRDRRRRFATGYHRDVRALLAWTFPDSRPVVTLARDQLESPHVTRKLCHRLYRDLADARALPVFYRRRAMRIDALHNLFAGECRLFLDQRARRNAQTAMNGFLMGLAVK